MKPPSKNPHNLLRVFRGGSWFITVALRLRAASRNSGSPAYRDFDNLGFRTTLTVGQPR